MNRRSRRLCKTDETPAASAKKSSNESEMNLRSRRLSKADEIPSTSKKSSSESEVDSDESFEPFMANSTNTSRKSQKAKQQSDPEPVSPNRKKRFEAEIKGLVCDCVYYMLVADQKKHAIKRSGIIKHVFQDDHKKHFAMVLSQANEALQEIYGLKIVEVEEKKGHYFLVNCDKQLKASEITKEEAKHRGLLLFILTVIFMNDHSLKEEELWKALKRLGVDCKNSQQHPVFGDVRKHVTYDLVKQLYLVRQKVSTEPPEYEYLWGPRAKHDVNKEVMLNFVCQIYGNEPQDWIFQYKEIQEEKAKEGDEEEEDDE